ncbi:hypothetical protein E5288_WYG001590 [Bos mutus]|uniref:Uncharacterized protein n=1 Tax=Bos mutus TaxID=72004 RepID=A0A6B0RH75_9CETA|nr:hypothetical protein [Bos mutus]
MQRTRSPARGAQSGGAALTPAPPPGTPPRGQARAIRRCVCAGDGSAQFCSQGSGVPARPVVRTSPRKKTATPTRPSRRSAAANGLTWFGCVLPRNKEEMEGPLSFID